MKIALSLTAAAAFALALAAGPVRAQPPADTQVPTDAQIAEIVVKANQVDVDAGRVAETKASSPEIRAFAREMVAVHGAIGRQAQALVRKLMIDPEASVTSHSLEGGGAANIRKLSGLKGTEFDRAYVGHEVAYHEQVIEAMDRILIPNARHARLKALLVGARPTFVEHLEHARHLQDALIK